MEQNTFLNAYFEQETEIERIAQSAAELHRSVAQTYGGYLPYEFHLRLTAAHVTRFGHLAGIAPDELQTVYAAAYFHDSLEDARLSYNDLKRRLEGLNAQGCSIHVEEAAEAVYALTNEKGRTREERANAHYYAGIRETRFAPFLKMCDRLANLRASTLYGIRQRMADVYQREMPHFLESIGPVPEAMKLAARGYLDYSLPRPDIQSDRLK